jgi:hypothetical protein
LRFAGILEPDAPNLGINILSQKGILMRRLSSSQATIGFGYYSMHDRQKSTSLLGNRKRGGKLKIKYSTCTNLDKYLLIANSSLLKFCFKLRKPPQKVITVRKIYSF